MSVSEYISVFVSIIVGVGVADLLISFHRLLRAGSLVRWYWLVPALAVYMLLVIVAFWWGTFYWLTHVRSLSMLQFLPNLSTAIAIFLLASAILPDEVPEQGIDLKVWYLANMRQVWILASIAIAITMFLGARSLSASLTEAGQFSWRALGLAFAQAEWDNILSLCAYVALIFTRRLRVHEFCVVVGLIDMVYSASWFQLG